MPMENLRINTLLFKFPNPEHNTFDGFQSVKKEYTNKVLKFFRVRNYLAATNFVGDVEVYVKVKDETYRNTNFVLFNRFCLKLNYNHIYNQPELVVSYGRTMRLCKYSLQKLSTIYANNYNQLQYADNVASPLQLVNKVLHSYRLDPEGNSVHLRIRTLKGIEKDQNENPQAPSIDKKTLFPIVNRSLQAFFGIPVNDDSYRNRNRYTRYLTEINNFIQKYLNEDFRKIIPIQDQFTQVEPYAISPTKADLLFGSSYHNNIPRQGLNNGTYQQPSANDVVLFFIYPENFRQSTLTKLYNYFTNECGTREPKYKGLIQYIGITAHGIGKFSITYNPNNSNAADEIARQLDAPERLERLNNSNASFLCIYLSPISKTNTDPEKHELYYQVKETLLRRNIASQCIDTNKLLLQIDSDNFKYTIQNMSVAINAKLGGTPWIIAGEQQRDLIIGVGAFRQNNHQYIGAAFVFNNVGAFNQYTYFRNDNLKMLAGAILLKIQEYTRLAESPSRLILHYYKRINKDEEHIIDEILQQLNLDIPVYILTINETESESVFVFDQADTNLMPISGRYVALGNDNYLLCNNIRYENTRYPVKDFAFPIKIHIYCKTPNALTPQIKLELLTQVYQFSRIYWKSVSQQNIPVTILYPKMIAEIMPHFRQKGVTEYIPQNRLWFL